MEKKVDKDSKYAVVSSGTEDESSTLLPQRGIYTPTGMGTNIAYTTKECT